MVTQVEVGSAVYAFEFLESEWEVEFDVGGCISIVSQFLMVVKTIVLRAHSEVYVPFHTVLLPFLEPFEFGTGLDEELHLHLLEFPHTEDELTSHDLVSECLAYLCDTERNLHTTGFLYVKIVYEDTLCGLRTKVYDVSTV